LRRNIHNCLNNGYGREILREIKALHYLDDTDILFYWKEILKGIRLLKKKKVVNLTEMRRLYISLVAAEMTIKERMSGGF